MYQPHPICLALRSYRVKARIRQDVVAGMLDVAQSQISRWESGRDMPRPHNIEAIRALLWGEAITPLLSLVHFVATSSLPLVLFDHEHRPLARGLPFAAPGNLLERCGWAFDPAANPAYAEIHAHYRAVLADPRGAMGLEIHVPFRLQGADWVGVARKTVYALEGRGVCLADLAFTPGGISGLYRPSLRRIAPPPEPAATPVLAW